MGQTTHVLLDGSSFKITDVIFHLPDGQRAGVVRPHVSSEEAREALARSRPGRELRDPDLVYAVTRLAGVLVRDTPAP